MDRFNGDQSKATFGPEWLKDPQTSHFASTGPPTQQPTHNYNQTTEEEQNQRFQNNHQKPRPYHANVKKVPLRFTRSKSTPLLPLEEQQQAKALNGKRPEETFNAPKERNSFDKDFPTLNTVKPKPTILHHASAGLQPNGAKPQDPPAGPAPNPVAAAKPDPAPGGGAWKSSQSKPIPLAGSASNPGGASTSPGTHGVTDTELQLASCIVPTVQPPKILAKNKVELLKKGSLGKKKIDATSILRKATSEPNLPIPPAYQENYAKLMAKKAAAANAEKEKLAKAGEKPKSGTVVLNRSDFFKGLVRKEIAQEESVRQHRRVVSDGQSVLYHHIQAPSAQLVTPGEDQPGERTPSGSSIASVEVESNVNNKESPEANPRNASNGSSRSTSPKISPEDEEKFLRDLGWVPDEEDHVPELTEEEILEEANKLKNWKSLETPQRKRLSLDVSIKQWQNDRERAYATKIC